MSRNFFSQWLREDRAIAPDYVCMTRFLYIENWTCHDLVGDT